MKFNLINSSLKEYDLNKSSIGCAPCLEEALKINKRSLTEIKIDEIKSIVRSIFKNSKNGTK
jgi:hypothetical protein